ncbi:hypothetical protein [Plesiocystis pacifica]|nr:hypothetical protein [Plesiocystis pacifica]
MHISIQSIPSMAGLALISTLSTACDKSASDASSGESPGAEAAKKEAGNTADASGDQEAGAGAEGVKADTEETAAAEKPDCSGYSFSPLPNADNTAPSPSGTLPAQLTAFAWDMFIGLNTAGDFNWQTSFMAIDDVMTGAKPDWKPTAPPRLGYAQADNGTSDGSGGYWLADERGELVWYEMRLNRFEFDYIVKHGLYSGEGQETFAESTGIATPHGSTEVKAAWLPIAEADAGKYVTTRGTIKGAKGVPREDVLLGLVGFHILLKSTNGGERWLWMTFEHSELTASFANEPHEVERAAKCQGKEGEDPVKFTAKPNEASPYTLQDYFSNGDCAPYATVVQRINAIAPDVAKTNACAKAHLAGEQQEALAHYDLMGVQWFDPRATCGTPQPPLKTVCTQMSTPGCFYQGTEDFNYTYNCTAPNTDAPLSKTGFLNSDSGQGKPLTNVMLETYVQTIDCASCHADASIGVRDSKLASNYSFVFDHVGFSLDSNIEPKLRPF